MKQLRFESLYAAFGGQVDDASLAALVDMVYDSSHTKSDIDATMHMAANMLGRSTVGAVTIDGLTDEYFEDIALLYVPQKSLHDPTIMYLVAEKQFVVGGVSEWVQSLS